MRTKDGVEYEPGMTLYHECLGEIEARPTRMDTDKLPEYALGVNVGYVKIDGHYARKENAYIAATNYVLKELAKYREHLARLNRERNADLFGTSQGA